MFFFKNFFFLNKYKYDENEKYRVHFIHKDKTNKPVKDCISLPVINYFIIYSTLTAIIIHVTHSVHLSYVSSVLFFVLLHTTMVNRPNTSIKIIINRTLKMELTTNRIKRNNSRALITPSNAHSNTKL